MAELVRMIKKPTGKPEPIQPDAILMDAYSDKFGRGDRVALISDRATQGIIDGFVHTFTPNGYEQSISVDWDDGTNTHVPRETICKVSRAIGLE